MSASKSNHRWIWYFVLLFVMAVTATVVLIVFNLQQQLKSDQLSAARKMWKDNWPPDYTLSYTTRVDADEKLNHYWVKVRGGRTVSSTFNGQPEAAELLPYRGMEAIFDFVEKFMKIDSEKGSPKTYVRALQTMVLVEAGQFDVDQRLIEENIQWLIDARVVRKEKFEGWGYELRSFGTDNSNGLYAMLGLWKR